jgi:hypothetical protein
VLFMKGLLKQLLHEMKERVVTNLEIIKKNEIEVKRLLAEPYSEDKNRFFQVSFSTNREILNDNLDYLELQLKIVGFMSKYNQSELMKQSFASMLKKDPSNIDFFNETVNGRFEFNEYHPYYRDEEFIDRLMAYYLEHERFEECENLTRIKKKILSV